MGGEGDGREVGWWSRLTQGRVEKRALASPSTDPARAAACRSRPGPDAHLASLGSSHTRGRMVHGEAGGWDGCISRPQWR